MQFTWRPLTLDDVRVATELNNTVAAADGTGEVTTPEALADSLSSPTFNPATDSISIWSGPVLIGAGNVFAREELVEGRALMGVHGTIHPDHRDQGLGGDLLTWLEDRAIELAAQRFGDAPVRLRTSGGLEGSTAEQLLESRGYGPDNYFITMEADLTTWTDPGVPTRAVTPQPSDQEAIREAHNDSFRDHRNHSPISARNWEHFASASVLRPALSQVVIEHGQVLAYAIAAEYQPGVVHVELVGTRRAARGRGLAKDVLIAGLRAARDAGYRISELEVDSTSPTGADRLYRTVGYTPVRVISRYIRDLHRP